MSDRVIRLPANNWKARPYQFKLWKYLCHGGKRAVAIHHRRAGKDEIGLHYAACAAMQRIGNFVHCLPEYLQGRRAIWTAINPHTGKRRIDEVFPEANSAQYRRWENVYSSHQRLDLERDRF